MNQNDFKNNSDVLAECTENMEYPLTVADVQPTILSDEMDYHIDTTDCTAVDIGPSEDNCLVQELPDDESAFIKLDANFTEPMRIGQESVVFAADGTLLSHDRCGQVLDVEPLPILTADGTVYEEIPGEVNPPEGLERMTGISAATIMPHNASLHISPGGWSNIPGAGWVSGAVNVTSNVNWTLSRNVTWLTPSIALGTWHGSGGFLVTVAANTTSATRTGTLTISASGMSPRNITFTQLGAVTSTLTVSPGSWSSIPASGWTSGAVNVTSNIGWHLSRNVTWLIPSIAPGNWYRSGGFTVRVEPNTSTAARTGNITIQGGGMVRNVTFNQLGAVTPNLTVSPSNFNNIQASGWTSGAINVTSNIGWHLSRNVTWLIPSIAPGNWYRSGGFTVRVEPNTSTTARTGTITIQGGGIVRNISFVQQGANILTPAPNFLWPVLSGRPRLVQGFHSGHGGIDIQNENNVSGFHSWTPLPRSVDTPANHDASGTGNTVVASMAGVVSLRMVLNATAGNAFVIAHGGGYFTRYIHLHRQNFASFQQGTHVSRGQTLGLTGQTGNVASNGHLHFEVIFVEGRNSFTAAQDANAFLGICFSGSNRSGTVNGHVWWKHNPSHYLPELINRTAHLTPAAQSRHHWNLRN